MSEFRNTRPDTFPPIVKNLIIINILVWVAQLMFDSQYDISGKLGLWAIQSPNFNPYQIATHMFAHASYHLDGQGNQVGINFYHILFNMFGLWTFGRILENVWGAKRFLFFYLACGVGAALTHMVVQYFEYRELLLHYNPDVVANYSGYVVGASGAVMGVFVAFAFLFPNTELFLMFIPVPIKAKWLVMGLIALDLFGGFVPRQGDNVAHFAHLGGAVTGFLIVLIWNKTNRRTLY